MERKRSKERRRRRSTIHCLLFAMPRCRRLCGWRCCCNGLAGAEAHCLQVLDVTDRRYMAFQWGAKSAGEREEQN